jgi:hypothetical protein
VPGTSVEALALLTYFKLFHYWSESYSLLVLISRNPHPALAFLRNNFEAKNTILGEVHISLFVKEYQHICFRIFDEDVPNRPAPLPLPCIVSPLKYEARGPFPSGPFKRAL